MKSHESFQTLFDRFRLLQSLLELRPRLNRSGDFFGVAVHDLDELRHAGNRHFGDLNVAERVRFGAEHGWRIEHLL